MIPANDGAEAEHSRDQDTRSVRLDLLDLGVKFQAGDRGHLLI